MTNLTEAMTADAWPRTQEAGSVVPSARGRGSADFQREVYCVLGLPFDALTMAQAVAGVRQAAFSNTRCFISTPNLNFLIAARTDRAFRQSVLNSDLSLADGMPLIWMARLLGLPLPERVSGAGLFEQLLAHAGPPVTVFFFGGPDGVAEAACARVNARDGGLRCVGFDSPGFASVEDISDAGRIARINASGAHFVIVALGAKKGQAWIERNAAQLDAPVLCHLGAVVNFAAGVVRRAPGWVQAVGMEWLWRIKEEPGLLKRYVGDGLRFLGLLGTRVLPDALRRLATSNARAPDQAPTVYSTVGTDRVTIELAGAWHRAALQPLRAALSAAKATGLPLCISMHGVTRVDSALIALLMLAVARADASVSARLQGISPRVARTFRRSGAEFLLHDPSANEGVHG
jgi:N-acetylglucosaminyldiphosphoundecaprenol N-acetyl-beta-D-mannosaminyltransferase